MTHEEVHAIVAPFYTQALTVNAQSLNGQETKSKAVLIKQVEFFWKLIPNLKWEPQDFVVSGNKVVVRSIASGSPIGSFMGLQLDGSKSFRIDTIDIHEVEGGQVVRVYHLEDWATAIKQLSAK
jgi:predicted ester cyclase